MVRSERELDLDKKLGLESFIVSFNGVFRCTVVIKIGHVDQLHLNHAAHINLSMYFILVYESASRACRIVTQCYNKMEFILRQMHAR